MTQHQHAPPLLVHFLSSAFASVPTIERRLKPLRRRSNKLFSFFFASMHAQVIMRTERPCPDLVDGKAGPALPIEEWKSWTISQVTDPHEELHFCCFFLCIFLLFSSPFFLYSSAKLIDAYLFFVPSSLACLLLWCVVPTPSIHTVLVGSANGRASFHGLGPQEPRRCGYL